MQRSTPPAHAAQPSQTDHRILVCLDRSEQAESCIPYAILIAKAFGANISLLHVMEAPADPAAVGGQDALMWEVSRREAEGYLKHIQERVSGALERPVDVLLEQGQPAERIADVAQDICAELTVLGRGGEGGSRDGHLGTTALRVLTLARASVFIVQATHASPWASIKCIMVPLNGSIRTESAIPAAVRIANICGAGLLLAHVVREPQPTPLHLGDDLEVARRLAQRFEQNAKNYLEELRKDLIHKVPVVRTSVTRHVNERRGLLEVAERERADLVVLSAHGSGCDSTRSFGTTASFLLAHSTIPLLALQDIPEHLLGRTEQTAATPDSLRASYAPGRV